MPRSNHHSLSKNPSSKSTNKILVATSTTGISDPMKMNKRSCSVVNDDDANPNQKKPRTTNDDYHGTMKKCSKPTPRCLFKGTLNDDDKNKRKSKDNSIDTVDEVEEEVGSKNKNEWKRQLPQRAFESDGEERDNDDDDYDDNDRKQKSVDTDEEEEG